MSVYVSNDPMKQFELQRIFEFGVAGVDLSFTNSALFMFVAVAAVSAVMWFGLRGDLVPTRMQSVAEVLVGAIRSTVRDVVGEDGMAFFPLVLTLFLFILFANFLGLFPYFFTTTSHLSVTLALGVLVFVIVVSVGIAKKGPLGFVGMFAPPGLPFYMVPFIWVIEFISFLLRPFTLGVRLFANMLAGHVMLKLFAGFVATLIGTGTALGALAIFPLLGVVAVVALEVLVKALQAYLFAVLTCIYLSEVVHDHH